MGDAGANQGLRRPRVYLASVGGGPLRQGEIIADVVLARLDLESIRSGAEDTIDRVDHPLAVVLSQDCDLDWDFKQRQRGESSLPAILFCEVTTATELKGRVPPASRIWGRIKQNKDERYQFLQAITREEDALGRGLPELGIDFKRYFTIPTEEVYLRLELGQIRRRSKLETPFAEHLSSRFCYFLSRVALPADHLSEPVGQ